MNTINYKFIKDGQEIEAIKELWCWEATYNDGTGLKQFGDDGIFHQFQEIDQSKLAVFKMVSDDKPPFTLIFNPSKMKLIHYYKRFRLNIGEENESKFTVFCFGYEIKTFGRTHKVNIMINPSGEVIITEDPNIINFE
jgi:hypothetical protein